MTMLTGDQQQQQQQQNEPPEWTGKLSDDLKSEDAIASFAKFKAGEGEELVPVPLSLARSYRELEKQLGSTEDRLVIPGADADPEEWNKLYTALGRPETPDEYGFKKPEFPAGVEYDETLTAGFAKLAHEAGLSAGQAQKIFDWWNGMTTERFNDATKKADEFYQQADTEFRTKWGAKYEDRMNKCKMVVNAIGGPDFKRFLSDTGLGNHPAMIGFMDSIANRVSEAAIIDGSDAATNKTLTRSDLEAMQRDPRYSGGPGVRDEGFIKKVEDGFKALYPDKKEE